MERLQIVDFERINTQLEQLEREPNEPAEFFLFRASEILRDSLPDQMKRDGFMPFMHKNAGNLLFAHPEAGSATDKILGKIEAEGYFPQGKFTQEKDPDIEEWIYPASVVVPEGTVDLSTSESAAKTFRRTTNSRSFFNNEAHVPNTLQDGIIENSFLLSKLRSDAEMKYMAQRLNDKRILLVGGNDSCRDLLHSSFKPKKIVNIDPFTTSESMGKNHSGIYESFPLAAEEEGLKEKLDSEEFEEIWANFSVPMYSRDPKAINDAFDNMVSLLAQGGTIRIYPLAVNQDFSIPKDERLLSDSMYNSLISKIKELYTRADLNVFYIQTNPYSIGTLFIQKIK